MPFSQHPLLGGLRSIREPYGRTLQVVEELCRRAKPPARPEAGWRPKMPPDDEIAARLGISAHTVRTHISTVANWIEGLEEFPPRVRIFFWYWHREWERSHATTPEVKR